MEKTKRDKRDFNDAAKFLLGLSMFATTMTIINSFLQISNMKMFGFVASDTLAIEIVIDFFILGAAVLTFLKKPAGLIALTGLFIIRMFATIQWDSDISNAYMLGGKMAILIRDFLPFSIAMCFKKNGISGWKSMLASEEYVAEHTTINERESKDTKDTSSDSFGEQSISMVADSSINSKSEQQASEIDRKVELTTIELPCPQESDKHSEQKRQKKESGPGNLSKMARIGIALVLCIVLALSIISLVVAIKSYPDYVASFGDKWKYTFNCPNDRLANKLYLDYENKRLNDRLLFFDVDDGAVVATSYLYDNETRVLNDYYNGSNSYLIMDTVRNASDIDSVSLYTARWSDSYKWARILQGGGKEHYAYDELIKRDPNLVYIRLKPFDLSSYLVEQEQRIETITSIPTRNISLIKKMIAHYVIKGNYNRALDVIGFYLDYNKKNAELLGFTGFLHYKTQDLDEANEFADRALSIDSKDLYGNLVKGCVAADRNDWAEAGKWSKKAIDYGSEVCEPYYTYGESLYQKGDTKQAREYYSKGYNKDPDSPLSERYKHCGGLPFDFVSLSFAFGKADGSIIIDYGERLNSSKSQYIMPKAKVNVVRVGDWKVQCKLYCRGTLQTGNGSPDGYTYDSVLYTYKTGLYEQNIGGWGNSTPGNWPAGNYKFEIWYEDKKVGEDWFTLY